MPKRIEKEIIKTFCASIFNLSSKGILLNGILEEKNDGGQKTEDSMFE